MNMNMKQKAKQARKERSAAAEKLIRPTITDKSPGPSVQNESFRIAIHQERIKKASLQTTSG